MDILTNKNILLGITGSIAAYKAADISSRLKKEGCNVKVVMTKSSELFITETTLESLSGNKVISEDHSSTVASNFKHLDLAKWADIILVSPCTANFMNKLANGHGDDLLSTICLAFTKKIYIAPAMNPDMWNNKVSQSNVKKLVEGDIDIIGPNYGSHACGDIGYGRMTNPEQIIEKIKSKEKTSELQGAKILVTAGPTREPIDPVRFMSNYSSGKMGYEIGIAAKKMGAYVKMISGPVSLKQIKGIETEYVETSDEMYQAVMSNIEEFDILISTAAIADYKPVDYSLSKYKKSENDISIRFTRGNDIISCVSSKYENIYTVGFAAETDQLKENAIDKLKKKNLNMIVGNIANHELKLGFESDYNQVTIFSKKQTVELPRAKKSDIAKSILKAIAVEISSNRIQLVNKDVK
jgi:phosphopantothenoylcysteine decarboxylase/phosphopantothenate--cysteine ligase